MYGVLATRGVSLWGRSVAEADSVLGLTAPLGDPPVVSPSSEVVVWEPTVSEVAPGPGSG